jgi:ankyrin repeat protein
MASLYGHKEVVQLLLKHPLVDPSSQRNSAIQWASEKGHKGVVDILLQDPCVDPSDRANEALRFASACVEVVKLLLSNPRVDPSDHSNLAILWASRFGHKEVVDLLCKDPRVDPSAVYIPLNYSIYSRNERHNKREQLLLRSESALAKIFWKPIEDQKLWSEDKGNSPIRKR